MAAEKYKDVTVGGRNFRIRKFPARSGSFVIVKIAPIIANMFRGVDLSKVQNVKDPKDVNLGSIDIFGVMERLGEISEKDFNYLQETALAVCSEILPSNPNPVPVLNDNGSFGVVGLEDDTVTVMSLTVHALLFNLTSFFTESPLEGLVGGILATPQQS